MALALTSLEKIGLEFFSQKILKSLSIFSPKIRSFCGVKLGPLGPPTIHLTTHEKRIGIVTKNSEILTEMSKKVKIPLLWRCNLYSKKQSAISQPILCWTWWDSVQVKSYPRCFGTPNLILIRWEMTEIWDLVRFTGRKGSFKWGFKNEPFYGWRPEFLT